ncbi:hypothetical protein SmJEL517_g03030 [Synchytrium microbalum]|uniref:methylated diphthine methylhydrolase n=1 Tax=Synchytrium microbalum TaxID=1806994 RepID=A0A507C9X3_9FUNG|nr:uncharacterized protein SmJEL517_g03030 [Synchytrium microbalum]TPX34305.1 hypothetical protein SmJEL517_g03030 [Synchytrium microbalum]
MKPLVKIRLDKHTDAVEFCPDAEHGDYLAVASYQVSDKSEQISSENGPREGAVTMFKYDSEARSLTKAAELTTSGTLDIKWNVFLLDESGRISATSGLMLAISTITLNTGHYEPEDVLILSLYIPPTPITCRIYTSISDGRVSVLNLDSTGLHPFWETYAHEYEAWCVSGDGENMVYSGGDDQMFCGWDLRSGQRTFKNKSHDMGVTCILPHPSPSTHPHIVFTGSYDEHLRIFDLRKPSSPLYDQILLEGGGVWKLKPKFNLTTNSYTLLAACMHAGVTLVDINSDLTVGVSSDAYKEHGSFVYGVDWKCDESVGASCSFEDNSVHLWAL